ncbi:MAG: DUF2845 domain-containing protein [Deltaproteobacteria bacterium]
MKKLFFAMLLSVLSLTFVSTAYAFRCGDRIVSIGESRSKVLIMCGEPTTKEKGSSKNKKKAKQNNKDGNAEDSGIEKWYYNCGANDFIYVLTFRSGKLAKETTEGYGTGKASCYGY